MRLRIAGVDEAGRGPLAGPVVAAAVILRRGRADCRHRRFQGAERRSARTASRAAIRGRALCFGIGWADPAEIDALNILQATFLAMRRAVLALCRCPDSLLSTATGCPARGPRSRDERAPIVGGDSTEPAISAASILAKTARDRYMVGWPCSIRIMSLRNTRATAP